MTIMERYARAPSSFLFVKASIAQAAFQVDLKEYPAAEQLMQATICTVARGMRCRRSPLPRRGHLRWSLMTTGQVSGRSSQRRGIVRSRISSASRSAQQFMTTSPSELTRWLGTRISSFQCKGVDMKKKPLIFGYRSDCSS